LADVGRSDRLTVPAATIGSESGGGPRPSVPAVRHRPAILPLAFLAVLWLAAALLVQPWGEFPLNDDWDYAKSARALAERGRFELSPEARVTLFAQAAWGALFSLPFGWSFVALRLSTVTAGLAGTFAVYGLARLAGASRRLATVAALTLAVCPLCRIRQRWHLASSPLAGG
jgi:hypothetical protein